MGVRLAPNAAYVRVYFVKVIPRNGIEESRTPDEPVPF